MPSYEFVGKKNHFYDSYFNMKLNYNCPDSYKSGEGQGSCKGYEPGSKESKPEKTKDVTDIKSITDYKAASPETKLAFLQSEISKGNQSTLLPDGTYISNIKSKARQLSKKIENSKESPAKQSKEITGLISETKKTISKIRQEQKSGKVSQESKLALKSEIEKLEGISKQKTNNGLEKIRQEIQQAGGPEKYFEKFIEPNAETLDPTDFKPVTEQELNTRYSSYIPRANIVNKEGDITFYELPDKTMVAKIGDNIAGYIRHYKNFVGENETDISVAKEHQQKGLSNKLMKVFYNKNPDAVKVPGGFTPAGKKATIRFLKDLSETQKHNESYPGFKTPTDLDKEIEKILASIEPDIIKAIKKTNYFESTQSE